MILPSRRRTQKVCNFSFSTAVRKLRSPHRQGDERPRASSIFQSRFVPGPKLAGGPSRSATPWQFTPRNWGQEEAPRSQGAASRIARPSGSRSGARLVFMARLESGLVVACTGGRSKDRSRWGGTVSSPGRFGHSWLGQWNKVHYLWRAVTIISL